MCRYTKWRPEYSVNLANVSGIPLGVHRLLVPGKGKFPSIASRGISKMCRMPIWIKDYDYELMFQIVSVIVL